MKKDLYLYMTFDDVFWFLNSLFTAKKYKLITQPLKKVQKFVSLVWETDELLKWNSPFITQDTLTALIFFAILIFTDISIKIHSFVCI